MDRKSPSTTSSEMRRIFRLRPFHRLFRKGCIVLSVALVCCIVSSLILRFWLKKLNKKSEQLQHESGLGFRYVL
jgi:hypothetical protein